MTTFDIFMLVGSIVALGIIWVTIGSIFNEPNPFCWVKGCITNKEFRTMMELILEDPKKNYNGNWLNGGGYSCRIDKGYAGFTVNDERNFTIYQRVIFFKMLHKVFLVSARRKQLESSLQLAKLSERIFRQELEGKLRGKNDHADNG